MAAPFAALESRLNAAVLKHVANRDAILNGATVSGIFDDGYAEQDFGGSASAPVYMLATASVPPSVVGMPMVISAITYKVVETMPDGTGVTLLRLRT